MRAMKPNVSFITLGVDDIAAARRFYVDGLGWQPFFEVPGEDGKDFGALTVKGDSPLKSPSELEGKKVAVNTLKNINETAVRESVRKAGGDPDKVEFVELAFDQMPAALDEGQIDAAMVVEPALATIKSQGGREIASSLVDVAPDLTVAMYFTSMQYAESEPEVVEKFQKATAESLAYADAHPDEVREIVTTYTKIPPDVLKAAARTF